jgi:hypothetical protein
MLRGLLHAGGGSSLFPAAADEEEEEEEVRQDPPAPPTPTPNPDASKMNDIIDENQESRKGNVYLFVRLVGEPYACFGRLSLAQVNLSTRPIQATWTLVDYDILKDNENFVRVVSNN